MSQRNTRVRLLSIKDFPLASNPNHQIHLTPKDKIQRYYSPAGGMIKFYVKLGETIYKNQKLYTILSFNKIGELPQIREIFAEGDGLIFDITKNHSVNQWDYVLGVMPS